MSERQRGIQVITEDLRSSAQLIRGWADDYKDLYRDQLIRGEIEGRMADHWQGVDYQAFSDEMKNDWQPQFDRMYQEMINYADFLIASANTYEQAQTDAVTRAKNIIS